MQTVDQNTSIFPDDCPLSYEELTDLIFAINSIKPNAPKIFKALEKGNIPKELWDRRTLPRLLFRIRREKLKKTRKIEMEEYLKNREVIVRIIKGEPLWDLPESLTYAQVKRRLHSRIARIYRGEDPEIRLEVYHNGKTTLVR